MSTATRRPAALRNPQGDTGTKERILDAAARLFAESGVAGTSLRAVTAAAGVNVAAVHYHFGSREGLVRALVARQVAPTNRERLARLDALEADARPHPAPVEAILDALVRPAFESVQAAPELRRLPGLLLSEPDDAVAALIDEAFGEVDRRFSAALVRALPDLDRALVYERFHFCVGAMIHLLTGRNRLELTRRKGEDATLDPAAVDRLVRFLATGMRGPAEVP